MSKRAISEPEAEEVKCPVCGEAWEKGEIFCYYCGYERKDDENPLHPPPVRDGVIVDPDSILDKESSALIKDRLDKIAGVKKIDLAVLLLGDNLRKALEPRVDAADGKVDITRSMEGLSYTIYNDWLMGKSTDLKGLLFVIDPKGEDRVLVQGRNGPGVTGSQFRKWFDGFEVTANMDEKTTLVKELELAASGLESI